LKNSVKTRFIESENIRMESIDLKKLTELSLENGVLETLKYAWNRDKNTVIGILKDYRDDKLLRTPIKNPKVIQFLIDNHNFSNYTLVNIMKTSILSYIYPSSYTGTNTSNPEYLKLIINIAKKLGGKLSEEILQEIFIWNIYFRY
jgi:hypothetical protein